MAITVVVECSYHQTNAPERREEIGVDTLDDDAREEVVTALAIRGWVVQFNGDSMDTYCSKKCAE